MKLENERKEFYYKYDMDCTETEKDALKKIAIERFAKDEKAQLEYAIVSILSEVVSTLNPESQIQVTKETKNGSKNNRSK